MCNALLNIAFVDKITPGKIEYKNIVTPPPPPPKKKAKCPFFLVWVNLLHQKAIPVMIKLGACAIKMMSNYIK